MVAETVFGRRIVVEFTKPDGSISRGARIRLGCGHDGCREHVRVYLVDTYAASVYAMDGEYLMSLRDQYWLCDAHHALRQGKAA